MSEISAPGTVTARIGDLKRVTEAQVSELTAALEIIEWSTQPRPYVAGDGFCVGAIDEALACSRFSVEDSASVFGNDASRNRGRLF